MAELFFTSDPHWGSATVAKFRGFDSPSAHDAALIEQWLKNVMRDDHVWVLGDLAMSSPTYALGLTGELPGHKHLVSGNHDRCSPMHRDGYRHQHTYLEVFDSVQPFARRRIAGLSVLLSHYPYHDDHLEPPRHMQYRLPDYGEFLLHGHTHAEKRYTSFTEMHVGLDAWDLAPVPLVKVEAWIRNQVAALEAHKLPLDWSLLTVEAERKEDVCSTSAITAPTSPAGPVKTGRMNGETLRTGAN